MPIRTGSSDVSLDISIDNDSQWSCSRTEIDPVTSLWILNWKKLQVTAWKIRRFEAAVPADAQIYFLSPFTPHFAFYFQIMALWKEAIPIILMPLFILGSTYLPKCRWTECESLNCEDVCTYDPLPRWATHWTWKLNREKMSFPQISFLNSSERWPNPKIIKCSFKPYARGMQNSR